eukprot:CAMPEP_0178566982 /NCGR_PEP_ID=MMETSP0697-20121206/15074_1 /TAXON_ID=265572 /ORGANISM="Extubocellulus spinifer, Strain CCMP396" /LENGTH=61 /DNA_ID=CAMNT_0020200869 /DNA_START=11 /DNA_END=193 /DNA_ORIENTATION=+
MAVAPSSPISLPPKLSSLRVVFSRRASASAAAPSAERALPNAKESLVRVGSFSRSRRTASS